MDVAIVGSGLVGLACAHELRRVGLEVSVFDRGEKPASLAAAGILGPQSEAQGPGPLVDLGLRSLELWPRFVEGLGEVGYDPCGTLQVGSPEHLARIAAWQGKAGLRVEEREGGLFFPAEGTVDNRLLVAALRERLRPIRAEVRAVHADRLELRDGTAVRARHVLVCAGAWSDELLPLRIFPVRGQMIALDVRPPRTVVYGEDGYLVPRRDRLLVGATVENAGFEDRTTPEGLRQLLALAARLAPGSERARVLEHWSGLRPATRDALPKIGRLESGVLVATGHFRNGILLAPITAAIIRSLVLGETSPVDLLSFTPSRRSA